MRRIYVLHIVVSLILVFENAESSNNIGLYFNSLTRIRGNETCAPLESVCRYFMKICFSLSENKCFLGNFTTSSWQISPGNTTTFSYFKPIADAPRRRISNPYRPGLNTWKRQEVNLNASIWKDASANTSVFIEQLYIRTRLPFPTNDWPTAQNSTTMTECGNTFCLKVLFYTWCPLLDCIENVSTVYSHPKTYSTSSFNLLPSSPNPISTRPLYTTKLAQRKENTTQELIFGTPSRIMRTQQLWKKTTTTTAAPTTPTPTTPTPPPTTTTPPPPPPPTTTTPTPTTPPPTTPPPSTTTPTPPTPPPTTPPPPTPTPTPPPTPTPTTQDNQGWTPPSRSRSCDVLLTISRSCIYNDGSNDQHEEGDLKKIVRSWWFLLSVILAGLLVIAGIIVLMARYKKKRRSNQINIRMAPKNKKDGNEEENLSS